MGEGKHILGLGFLVLLLVAGMAFFANLPTTGLVITGQTVSTTDGYHSLQQITTIEPLPEQRLIEYLEIVGGPTYAGDVSGRLGELGFFPEETIAELVEGPRNFEFLETYNQIHQEQKILEQTKENEDDGTKIEEETIITEEETPIGAYLLGQEFSITQGQEKITFIIEIIDKETNHVIISGFLIDGNNPQAQPLGEKHQARITGIGENWVTLDIETKIEETTIEEEITKEETETTIEEEITKEETIITEEETQKELEELTKEEGILIEEKNYEEFIKEVLNEETGTQVQNILQESSNNKKKTKVGIIGTNLIIIDEETQTISATIPLDTTSTQVQQFANKQTQAKKEFNKLNSYISNNQFTTLTSPGIKGSLARLSFALELTLQRIIGGKGRFDLTTGGGGIDTTGGISCGANVELTTTLSLGGTINFNDGTSITGGREGNLARGREIPDFFTPQGTEESLPVCDPDDCPPGLTCVPSSSTITVYTGQTDSHQETVIDCTCQPQGGDNPEPEEEPTIRMCTQKSEKYEDEEKYDYKESIEDTTALGVAGLGGKDNLQDYFSDMLGTGENCKGGLYDEQGELEQQQSMLTGVGTEEEKEEANNAYNEAESTLKELQEKANDEDQTNDPSQQEIENAEAALENARITLNHYGGENAVNRQEAEAAGVQDPDTPPTSIGNQEEPKPVYQTQNDLNGDGDYNDEGEKGITSDPENPSVVQDEEGNPVPATQEDIDRELDTAQETLNNAQESFNQIQATRDQLRKAEASTYKAYLEARGFGGGGKQAGSYAEQQATEQAYRQALNARQTFEQQYNLNQLSRDLSQAQKDLDTARQTSGTQPQGYSREAIEQWNAHWQYLGGVYDAISIQNELNQVTSQIDRMDSDQNCEADTTFIATIIAGGTTEATDAAAWAAAYGGNAEDYTHNADIDGWNTIETVENENGEPVYETEDGETTTNPDEAATDDQGNPVRVTENVHHAWDSNGDGRISEEEEAVRMAAVEQAMINMILAQYISGEEGTDPEDCVEAAFGELETPSCSVGLTIACLTPPTSIDSQGNTKKCEPCGTGPLSASATHGPGSVEAQIQDGGVQAYAEDRSSQISYTVTWSRSCTAFLNANPSCGASDEDMPDIPDSQPDGSGNNNGGSGSGSGSGSGGGGGAAGGEESIAPIPQPIQAAEEVEQNDNSNNNEEDTGLCSDERKEERNTQTGIGKAIGAIINGACKTGETITNAFNLNSDEGTEYANQCPEGTEYNQNTEQCEPIPQENTNTDSDGDETPEAKDSDSNENGIPDTEETIDCKEEITTPYLYGSTIAHNGQWIVLSDSRSLTEEQKAIVTEKTGYKFAAVGILSARTELEKEYKNKNYQRKAGCSIKKVDLQEAIICERKQGPAYYNMESHLGRIAGAPTAVGIEAILSCRVDETKIKVTIQCGKDCTHKGEIQPSKTEPTPSPEPQPTVAPEPTTEEPTTALSKECEQVKEKIDKLNTLIDKIRPIKGEAHLEPENLATLTQAQNLAKEIQSDIEEHNCRSLQLNFENTIYDLEQIQSFVDLIKKPTAAEVTQEIEKTVDEITRVTTETKDTEELAGPLARAIIDDCTEEQAQEAKNLLERIQDNTNKIEANRNLITQLSSDTNNHERIKELETKTWQRIDQALFDFERLKEIFKQCKETKTIAKQKKIEDDPKFLKPSGKTVAENAPSRKGEHNYWSGISAWAYNNHLFKCQSWSPNDIEWIMDYTITRLDSRTEGSLWWKKEVVVDVTCEMVFDYFIKQGQGRNPQGSSGVPAPGRMDEAKAARVLALDGRCDKFLEKFREERPEQKLKWDTIIDSPCGGLQCSIGTCSELPGANRQEVETKGCGCSSTTATPPTLTPEVPIVVEESVPIVPQVPETVAPETQEPPTVEPTTEEQPEEPAPTVAPTPQGPCETEEEHAERVSAELAEEEARKKAQEAKAAAEEAAREADEAAREEEAEVAEAIRKAAEEQRRIAEEKAEKARIAEEEAEKARKKAESCEEETAPTPIIPTPTTFPPSTTTEALPLCNTVKVNVEGKCVATCSIEDKNKGYSCRPKTFAVCGETPFDKIPEQLGYDTQWLRDHNGKEVLINGKKVRAKGETKSDGWEDEEGNEVSIIDLIQEKCTTLSKSEAGKISFYWGTEYQQAPIFDAVKGFHEDNMEEGYECGNFFWIAKEGGECACGEPIPTKELQLEPGSNPELSEETKQKLANCDYAFPEPPESIIPIGLREEEEEVTVEEEPTTDFIACQNTMDAEEVLELRKEIRKTGFRDLIWNGFLGYGGLTEKQKQTWIAVGIDPETLYLKRLQGQTGFCTAGTCPTGQTCSSDPEKALCGCFPTIDEENIPYQYEVDECEEKIREMKEEIQKEQRKIQEAITEYEALPGEEIHNRRTAIEEINKRKEALRKKVESLELEIKTGECAIVSKITKTTTTQETIALRAELDPTPTLTWCTNLGDESLVNKEKLEAEQLYQDIKAFKKEAEENPAILNNAEKISEINKKKQQLEQKINSIKRIVEQEKAFYEQEEKIARGEEIPAEQVITGEPICKDATVCKDDRCKLYENDYGRLTCGCYTHTSRSIDKTLENYADPETLKPYPIPCTAEKPLSFSSTKTAREGIPLNEVKKKGSEKTLQTEPYCSDAKNQAKTLVVQDIQRQIQAAKIECDDWCKGQQACNAGDITVGRMQPQVEGNCKFDEPGKCVAEQKSSQYYTHKPLKDQNGNYVRALNPEKGTHLWQDPNRRENDVLMQPYCPTNPKSYPNLFTGGYFTFANAIARGATQGKCICEIQGGGTVAANTQATADTGTAVEGSSTTSGGGNEEQPTRTVAQGQRTPTNQEPPREYANKGCECSSVEIITENKDLPEEAKKLLGMGKYGVVQRNGKLYAYNLEALNGVGAYKTPNDPDLFLGNAFTGYIGTGFTVKINYKPGSNPEECDTQQYVQRYDTHTSRRGGTSHLYFKQTNYARAARKSQKETTSRKPASLNTEWLYDSYIGTPYQSGARRLVEVTEHNGVYTPITRQETRYREETNNIPSNYKSTFMTHNSDGTASYTFDPPGISVGSFISRLARGYIKDENRLAFLYQVKDSDGNINRNCNVVYGIKNTVQLSSDGKSIVNSGFATNQYVYNPRSLQKVKSELGWSQ